MTRARTLFTNRGPRICAKGYKIRVNSMHPGTIDTIWRPVLVARARNLGNQRYRRGARQQILERLPIGRMGTPLDIARASSFSPRRCRPL